MEHEHIQAFLMYEIIKKLEYLQRRGIGSIDLSYTGGIDYKIDETVYHIKISENNEWTTFKYAPENRNVRWCLDTIWIRKNIVNYGNFRW